MPPILFFRCDILGASDFFFCVCQSKCMSRNFFLRMSQKTVFCLACMQMTVEVRNKQRRNENERNEQQMQNEKLVQPPKKKPEEDSDSDSEAQPSTGLLGAPK